MEKASVNRVKRVFSFFLGSLLSIFMLYGCASQKPQLNASMYRFTYDNAEAYRIRSISSEDTSASYNELIGQNVLAVDFDQDRILDYIVLGEMSLSEAQKVYEHGISNLAKENKLRVRTPDIFRYIHASNGLQIEIISFRPANAPPFNEFKIIDKRPVVCPEPIIVLDKNADGTLDETLKGPAAPQDVQSQYLEAIGAGLLKNTLVKVDGAILVREK